VQGSKAVHVIAFARAHGSQAALVVVPRLPIRLSGGKYRTPVGREVWQDTGLVLPGDWKEAAWRDVLTGEKIATSSGRGSALLPLADLLTRFPVAFLERLK
jgi:(1->4)-alpha-D-glucan 1-alpha-D-glucosylmutase